MELNNNLIFAIIIFLSAVLLSCNNKKHIISNNEKDNYVVCDSLCKAQLLDDMYAGNQVGIENYLRKGHNPNIKLGVYDWTPMVAIVKSNNFELVDLALENGANIDQRFYLDHGDCYYCNDSINVIHQLAFSIARNQTPDKIKLLKKLTQNNDLINSIDKYGMTPLDIYVSQGNNLNIIETLVSIGGTVETEKRSALIFAAEFSKYNIVEKLLEYGADPNFKNKKGKTPLDLCRPCCGDGFGENINKEDKVATIRLLEMHMRK